MVKVTITSGPRNVVSNKIAKITLQHSNIFKKFDILDNIIYNYYTFSLVISRVLEVDLNKIRKILNRHCFFNYT